METYQIYPIRSCPKQTTKTQGELRPSCDGIQLVRLYCVNEEDWGLALTSPNEESGDDKKSTTNSYDNPEPPLVYDLQHKGRGVEWMAMESAMG